ncbi:hypothetical protein SAMN00120144_0202 [Hymenobacter roseosalivarius DSM 11622]|uniref:IPT/TIG domain-containing protein n=1 Tax=Hymenobacter roseosalivarius DSM 11622 TaxID=645990 RepID=A0A1W1W2X0_9BACT|nr:IPT/TIG domain-containing protein [Hymenobacter roseosalivarius]SMB99454.1 hypothetical protein SAMN00120144_0202 [Hymenobacter roseosalivarius DSM 11622]
MRAASAAQSFTVSGTALTDRISATAPAGFELALDPVASYAPTVSITPAAGAVVVVYVRLAAAAAPGSPRGTIEVSSPGSLVRSVAVTGTVALTPPTASSAPTLTDFLPAMGSVGTLLTITGTNFTGATAVTFNGTSLPGFTVLSASAISVSIPGSISPGSGLLTVVTPTGTASSATSFAVVVAGPSTLRTGTMMPQGGVPSSGTLAIDRNAAGTEFVRFDANFRTDFHTGSLGVYLALSSASIRSQRTANPNNVLRVGTITREGAQTLAIPGSAAGFTHVIIHCDPAQINFGAAQLQ